MSMTQEEVLEIIDAVKVYSLEDETIVYPFVSFMCRNGYVQNWECINEDFYIDGVKIV